MRKLFILLIISIFTLNTFAQISNNEIRTLAKNYYAEKVYNTDFVNYNDISVKEIQRLNSSIIIANMYPEGWLMIANYKSIQPILAFSFTSYFDINNINSAVASICNKYSEQISDAKENNYSNAENISQWDIYTANNFTITAKSTKSIAPMLSTIWNQSTPYNELCPADLNGPGDRALVGCVPTAMAQIMNYYKHPLNGTSSYTYTDTATNYGPQTADFANTTYRWNEMPFDLEEPNTALPELLYHLGVSVDIRYGANGTGMWNHKAAYSLRTYFGYSANCEYIFRDTCTMDWDSIMTAQLDQGIPLYYAGWADTINVSGHAFVCDGYQDTTFYHYNWGWGGSQDGYFDFNNLTPGNSDFTLDHELIVNIIPTNPNIPSCGNLQTYTSVSGMIYDGSGPMQNYIDNADCSWLIAPNDSVETINLIFAEINLDNSADTIFVYDGNSANAPLLDKLHINNMHNNTISSTAKEIFIEFKTDASGNAEGFIAYWYIDEVRYCSNMTTVSTDNGIITDGSGDYNYKGLGTCRWRIRPPSATAINLFFNEFDLDSSDQVEIYDELNASSLGIFTGNNIPASIFIPSNKVMVEFTRNIYDQSQGFEIEWVASGTGIDENYQSSIKVYPNPAKDNLMIEISENRNYIYSISDINGREIITGETNNSTTSINISQLEKGIYILRMEDHIIKFVKE